MKIVIALAALAGMGLSLPLQAAPRPDPQDMVRSREAAVRVEPRNAGAQIELAAAYQRAGRAADARTTLRRALTLDNMMLETPTGDAVWSREVARRALARDEAVASR